MGVKQSISQKNPVLIMLEHDFFLQNDSPDTINGSRHTVTIKFTDVLVAIGAEVVSAILMKAKIELGTMLNYCNVQRGEQYMIFFIQFRNGHYQQPMILASITVNNRRTRIRARPVGAEQLSGKRLFQIGHQTSFKSKIAHNILLRC